MLKLIKLKWQKTKFYKLLILTFLYLLSCMSANTLGKVFPVYLDDAYIKIKVVFINYVSLFIVLIYASNLI